MQRARSIKSFASTAIPPPVNFGSLLMPKEQVRRLRNKKLRQFYAHQNEMIARFMEVDRVIERLKGLPKSYGTTRSSEQLSSNVFRDIFENNEDEEQSVGVILRQQQQQQQDEEQLSLSSALFGTDALLGNIEDDHQDASPWLIHLAINLSFAANLLLFVTKFVLALYSGSMAILATAFESLLDLLCNGIIFATMRMMQDVDWYNYPVGKARMEPLGIIVFSVVVTTSFTQVLVSSIERLTDPSKHIDTIDLNALSLGILISNIFIKALLWLWCRSIKGSSSVQALAQDHGNDVAFNTASTVFPVVASWANLPWIDPVGAILLSIYIIYEWMVLLLANIRRLTGYAASVDDLKQLTYMAYRFSRRIVAVDTVRAYYVGDRLSVEIDIILPPDYPLCVAHDIGESLQNALESMDNVERAFVHLDYNSVHEIEHRKATVNT